MKYLSNITVLIFVFLFLACNAKTEKSSSANAYSEETTEAKEEVVCDSLDYVLPQEVMYKIDFKENVQYHELTESEILKVKKLLSDYIEKKRNAELSDRFKENVPYNFDKYIRQYFAIEKNGEIIVMVHLIGCEFAPYLGISKKRLQSDFVYPDNLGGSDFAYAEINLSTDSVMSYQQAIM